MVNCIFVRNPPTCAPASALTFSLPTGGPTPPNK
jgi:hypothetical protein